MGVKPGAIIIEGHIQGLSNTRSLGEAGIPVYVTDVHNCIARYSRYCSRFFICPDFRSEAFIDFLIDLALSYNLKDWVLIPSNDHIVYSIAANKHNLEKYYKIITPGLPIIYQIYDKLNLISVAHKTEVPHPLTYTQDTFNHDTYPVLIKGRKGLTFYKTFGKKAFKVYDKDDYEKCFEKIRKLYAGDGVFIQELIRNNGKNKAISFAAFAVEGDIRCYWMGIKHREHPVEFGTGTFAQSIYVEDCLKYSTILLKELAYTGVCEIEYMLDPKDNHYKLIEINARTWLWVGLAKACGIDFAKMIYNFANDLPFAYPTNYKTNIKWRNSFTDIVYTCIAIIKGVTSLRTVINQNKGLIIDAIALKGDNKPFWAYMYLSISYLFRR